MTDVERTFAPLGSFIERERLRRSWTRGELAAQVRRVGRDDGGALQVAEKTVERWERRGAVPLPVVLRALARVLERPVEELGALARGESAPEAVPLRVAIAVVVRRHETLLVRRRDNGLWQWPAGIVKPEADARQVAIDCALAETGVSVAAERPLGERVTPQTHVHALYWWCSWLAGEPSNHESQENHEVRWMDRTRVTQVIEEGRIFPPVLEAVSAPVQMPPGEKPTVVTAIIVHERRVLLLRRRDGSPPWVFPGGEQEPDEDLEGTAIRETLEEVGLYVVPTEHLWERVHPKTGRRMVYFACRTVGGTARVADVSEVAEVLWLDAAGLGERVPAANIFPPVLAHLDRHLA